ncbi:MAG: hypothetical protein LBE49_03815 [Deltaproteobacteria bacterium]|jgi:hypothetical protein|nr:hypothetical protein [Deltaproteobacteria bacterium]
MISPEELEGLRKLLRSAGAISLTTTPAALIELATTLDFVTLEVAGAALASRERPKPAGAIQGEKLAAFMARYEAFLRKIASDIESGAIPRPTLPAPSKRAQTRTKLACLALGVPASSLEGGALGPDKASGGRASSAQERDTRPRNAPEYKMRGSAGPDGNMGGSKEREYKTRPYAEEDRYTPGPKAGANRPYTKPPAWGPAETGKIRPSAAGSAKKPLAVDPGAPSARLTVRLPMDLYMRLKVKAVLERTTITKMVTDWVVSAVDDD